MVKGVGEGPRIPDDIRELVFQSEYSDGIGEAALSNVVRFMEARGKGMENRKVNKGFHSDATTDAIKVAAHIFRRSAH